MAITTEVPIRFSSSNRSCPTSTANKSPRTPSISVPAAPGEEQPRPSDHRAGNGDSLLLAARQGRRQVVDVVGEADPGEQLGDMVANLPFLGPGDAERQRDVVERRQVVDQAELLEDDADSSAQRRQLQARNRRHVPVEQVDGPAARPQRQIEEPKQRRLAGAGRPGEKVEGSRRQLEAEAGQHFGSMAVPSRDVLESHHPRLPFAPVCIRQAPPRRPPHHRTAGKAA